jgi:hypothetical protein
MAQVIFKNNAQTTLSASISATDTTIPLHAGGGILFPIPSAGQYFVGTMIDAATGLLNEIVWCTAFAGTDLLTVVRGQEGTSPKGWTAGDSFAELWTAGQAGAMLQKGDQQSGSTNYAQDVGTPNAIRAVFNPAITTLIPGMPLNILIANANTGPTTLDVGTGAGAVRDIKGQPLKGGELAAGTIVQFFWTGAIFVMSYALGAAAGLNGQVQFNDAGVFGGSSNFIFDKATPAFNMVGTFNVTGAGNINANNKVLATYLQGTSTIYAPNMGDANSNWTGKPIPVTGGGTGLASIPFSPGSNGYIYLLGGLGMQWGQYAFGGDSGGFVPFSRAFSGGPYGVWLTPNDGSLGLPQSESVVTAANTSGFSMINGSDRSRNFFWMALGYY